MVDADIVAFKFASANQEVFDWGNGTTSKSVTPLNEVTPQVDEYLEGIREQLKADHLIICLSCPHEENFRLTVLESYKGNRDYDNRPVLLTPIKEYLAQAYSTYARPTLEADDVMGILATNEKIVPGRKIIVSEDKDMKTIPGLLFNPRKHTKPVLISKEQADYWHLYQTIIGDATDHYAGCPGAGPEKAEEFLQGSLKYVPYEHTFTRGPRKGLSETRYTKEPSESPWVSVVSLFEKAGLTEEDALVQARVARICRSSDYDFKEKKVKLWTPPN